MQNHGIMDSYPINLDPAMQIYQKPHEQVGLLIHVVVVPIRDD
jgi:hypothetical protein